MKTFIQFIAIFIFSFTTAFSQWSATLNIVPYPSPYTSDWENDPSAVGQLIINNNSGSPETIQVLSVATREGTEVFEGTSDEITVQPGVPATIDNTRLLNFETATFPNNDLKNKTIRTGRLSEGHYELCITVQDPSRPGHPLVSNVCASFLIRYPNPPSLVFPDNGDSVTNGQPTFSWTPITIPPPNSIHYSLKIVEVLDGQTPQRALEANTPPQFEQDNLNTTTLTYPISGLAFEAGKTYAWQVTALDQNNFPPTENNGKSDIYTFTYKTPSSGIIHRAGPDTGTSGGHTHTAVEAITSSCIHQTPLRNTNDISASTNLAGMNLTIGGFTLHVNEVVNRSSDATYQGTGFITWSPQGSPIKLAVTFNNIKVNTDNTVYQGQVLTTMASRFSSLDQLATATSLSPVLSDSWSDPNGSLDGYLSRHLISSQGGNSTPVDLPLGLRNSSLSSTSSPSTLAIVGIVFTPSGASMNVLYNLNIIEADKWISFFKTCFRINPNGMDSGGILYLPQDESMSINGSSFVLKGCSNSRGAAPDTVNKTYVVWNQNGLQRIVASAERSFSRTDIVAVSDDGTRMSQPEKMQLNFTFTDWNDWIARATPEHDFEIANLPGFTISASSGYYDHSVNQNPGIMSFPNNYTDGPQGVSFQGLYFPNLTMSLPEGFKKFGRDDRINFSFQNLILHIDDRGDHGVTVDIDKPGILPFGSGDDEGDLGGWPFSIDNINISIANNTPTRTMSMNGKLKLPLSRSSSINYTCSMNTGASNAINYNFDVSNVNGRSYQLDAWPASMNLQGGSTINITHDDEGIVIRAVLNGTMSISIPAGGHSSGHLPVHVSLPGLPFQNFTITNRDEDDKEGLGFNRDADVWGSDDGQGPDASQSSDNGSASTDNGESAPTSNSGGHENGSEGEQGEAGGFKATLGKLEFTGPTLTTVSESDHIYRLSMGINIELGLGFGESGISGGTKLTLGGDIHVPGTTHPYINNVGLDLNEISLSGDDLGPLTLKGELDFFPDARHAFTYSSADLSEYGHGVQGNLKIEIKGLADFNFHTIFGTVHNGGDPFHYWGVGGSVYMQSGIQVGPVEINGLGGGFAYNMQIPLPDSTKINGPTTHSTSREANENKLVPSQHSVVISLKVFLSLIRPRIVNVIARARVGINTKKGFSAVSLSGFGAILAMNPPEDSHPIGSASLHLLYNYPAQMFDGSLNGNVNLGISSVHLPIEMHAEPHKFWLYIGTPSNRASFTLIKIPPGPAFNRHVPPGGVRVYLGANGYMDMGTQLPPFPQLPSEVLAGLRNAASSKRASDNSVHSLLQLLGGAGNPGFMFGAEIRGLISVPIVPLILRGSASATVGFDVALEHINNADIPAACTNRRGKFGLNHWYAMGQLYAYLDMDLTFTPTTWFGGHPDTVLGLAVGAVMQAGFPNPSWADGKVWVNVHAFGAHISGYKHFKFGKKCYTNYNPMDHIRMITKVGPTDSASVFATPFTDFGLPMNGAPMHVTVPPDRNHNNPYTRTYRFRLTQFKLYKVNGRSSTLVDGNRHHNSDRKYFTFSHNNTLEPNTHYRFHVHCYAQELRNGSWRNPAEGPIIEDTTIRFKTGPAPTKIISNNVVFTYPINGQRYLLKDVFSNKGRIKLGQWQGTILPVQPPGTHEYNYLVKFIPEGGGDTINTQFTPDRANKSLDFHIPSALKNSSTYTMQVWVSSNTIPSQYRQQNNNAHQTPAERNAMQNRLTQNLENMRNNNPGLSPRGDTMEVNPKNNKGGNTIEIHGTAHANLTGYSYTPPPKPIYTLRFHTSKFNTFAEKMNALDPLKADREDLFYHIKIYSNNENTEPFDVFEIKGYNSSITTVSQNQNHFPPMFRAYIPYDASNPIDKSDMDNLYNPTSQLSTYGFNIELGAPEVRNNRGFPSFSLSTSDMTYSPPLNSRGYQMQKLSSELLQHPVQVVNALDLNGGSNTYSFAGTQTMNSAGRFTAGRNVSVPGTYTDLQFHIHNPNSGINARMSNYANRSGHGNLNHQSSYGANVPNSNTPSTKSSNNEYHSFQLVWKQDEYLHADQQLLYQGAWEFLHRTHRLSGLSYWTISGSNTLATGEFGNITFTSGSSELFGGLITGRFISQAQMQRIAAILDNIPNTFTMLNRLGTLRKIYFQYRYPAPNSGVPPVTVIKHLNEMTISRQEYQRSQQRQHSVQLQSGRSVPIILNFK